LARKNHSNNLTKKIRSSNNLSSIAEILGLMEEKGKGKNWLLEEIKRRREPIKVSPSKNSDEILKNCSSGFIKEILKVLKTYDFSVPDVKTSKNFHWFFTDIVGSSIPKIQTTGQVDKILQLNEQIKRTETFKQTTPEDSVIVPTGDGMVIGFTDSPEKPLKLAIELHKALHKYNEKKPPRYQIKIRIGIDTGPVFLIKDLNDNDTVWGPGIIMARRVMDLCAPMQILASQRIAEDVKNLTLEYSATIHKIGTYNIKHGNQLMIYNIFGDNFGNKNISKKGKTKNKLTESQDVEPFVFDNIDVKLDVLDPKTMLTHHTWIWNIKNTSEKLIDHISYFLEGDTPKEWKALNVKVKDNKNHVLQTIIDENKDLRKVFKAEFVQPLKPKKHQKITMEFDWEEPDRKYGYVVSSNCKKLTYKFTIPKGVDVKNRVLKVNPGTRNKIYAKPTSKVKFLKEKTEISWQAKSLKALDEYEFQW